MMHPVGSKVRLVKDEGLDSPVDYQGQVGTVMTATPNDPTAAHSIMILDVQMPDGNTIKVTDYQVVGA